ncbi:stabilizer of axonemal microtubules 3-like [Halichondria panicea]|uniref:stabilizer of axonemal microtubules 3-like n=1 Tax=Halichondria panicea TaxID=6063 RepID=UPI00312B5FC7
MTTNLNAAGDLVLATRAACTCLVLVQAELSKMERMSTVTTTETRNDLHLTSTGVSHAIRDTVQSPQFNATRTNPLPPSLAAPRVDPRLTDTYQTTTGTVHCYQPSGTILSHPTHKKAAGNWRVDYTLDTINKLSVKPWRRPLVMGNQCSEMKGSYKAKPETISSIISHSGNPQPPMLADHFCEGPTKGLHSSTVNKALQGRSFIPQNQAVLDRLEPYMTTNHWYHRTFSGGELKKYPKKDVATYWQCENYPKAWGHGMKENPLPRKLSRTDPGPMRDRTLFRTGTIIPRLPGSPQPIASGLMSLYSDMYKIPSEKQRQQIFHCSVKPFTQVDAPDKTMLQAVPGMYKTVNMTYGTGPPQIA